MNSLKITFSAVPALSLPIAYNAMLQGFLYHCWREDCGDLHTTGYTSEGKVFRLFTFSWLEGAYTIEGKSIRFEGPVSFEVRSPLDDLMEHLMKVLLVRGEVQLGQRKLPLLNLQAADRLYFPKQATIRMRTPMTIHVSQPDGKTVFVPPNHGLFQNMVEENLRRKALSCGLTLEPELWLEANRPPIQRMTSFKGTYIKGWVGRYRLVANPDTMRFLYYAGLGDRNSQGFGMFDIEEKIRKLPHTGKSGIPDRPLPSEANRKGEEAALSADGYFDSAGDPPLTRL